MSRPRRLSPQSVWDQNAVLQAFQEADIKPINAYRLWGHLIRHPEASWADVPCMPKAAVALLDKFFVKFTTTVMDCKRSSNGDTIKLLVQLQDGLQVEAVVMTYSEPCRDPEMLKRQADQPANQPGDDDDDEEDEEAAPSVTGVGSSTAGDGADDAPSTSGTANGSTALSAERKRSTLCVSSQVGCQMGCTFCATGTMGLKGNLNAGEITEQLVHARTVAKIRNIVFMGMGEPLNNYEAVKGSVRMMTDPRFFALKRRHVTISTVGVIPRIRQLAVDLPGVSLALSLHAPTQEVRLQIVPSARAFKLPALMEAVRNYMDSTGQKVFFEYVMLAGVNDSQEQAHQLGQLLKGWNVVLNLIPWNPVYQPQGPFFDAPAPGSTAAFQSILISSYGVHTTVRQEMGQDISGACGQLVIEAGGGGCSKESAAGKDIEEVAAGLRRVDVA